MANENKTVPTGVSVQEFLDKIEDPQKQADCKALVGLMQRATGYEPKVWGDAIVGYGHMGYKYPSGRTGEWFYAGFSPRKANLTVYMGWGFDGLDDYLARLGKYKVSGGCLYLKRLSDVDNAVLEEMVKAAVDRPAPQGVTLTDLPA